jgi:hypothetical protein
VQYAAAKCRAAAKPKQLVVKPKRLAVVPKAEPAPSPPAVLNIAEYPHSRPWLERRLGECAFPVGTRGGETYSCCAETEDRGADVYCAQHREVMYVRKPPRRKIKLRMQLRPLLRVPPHLLKAKKAQNR